MCSPMNHDIITAYHPLLTSLHTCLSTCTTMLQIKEVQAITLSLSENVTPAIFKMAASMASNTPMGSLEEVDTPVKNEQSHSIRSSHTLESLFWKYWRLDVECCIGKTHIFQAILHLLSGRVLKGCVSLGKARTCFHAIVEKCTELNSIPVSSTSINSSLLGEAVFTLKNNVLESMTFAHAIFLLVACVVPNLHDTLLKPLQFGDDKW